MTHRRIDLLLKPELLLFIAGVILFTFYLIPFGSTRALGLEGARYALFTQEMFRHGFSFFVTEYGNYYPDYLATQSILACFFSLFTGKVTTFTLVLPTAIAAATTLVLTYRLGALQSPEWGYYAALFLLITFEFFTLARAPSLDQYVALATIFCFYLAYASKIDGNNRRLKWIPLGLIGGFLFRGPLGLVIPAGVLCVFFLIEKKYWQLFIFVLLSFALLAACVMGLLALAYHTGGHAFAHSVWDMQFLSRLNQRGHRPFYYYPITALIAYAPTFPLALLTLFGALRNPAPQERKNTIYFLRLLSGWVFIVLIGLSIPADKHLRYILAIMPALALIAPYPLIYAHTNPFLEKIRAGILQTCHILPWLGISIAISGITYNITKHYPLDAYWIASLILFSAIGISAKFFRSELAVFTGGCFILIFSYIFIISPIAAQTDSLAPLSNIIAPEIKSDTAIIFYRVGPDLESQDIKLMALLDKPITPQFFSIPTQLNKLPKNSIVITQRAAFEALPPVYRNKINIIFNQKIGDIQWVVFIVR